MAIIDRTLKNKEHLVASYGGTKYVIEVVSNKDGTSFKFVEPKSFKGPQDAKSKSLHGGSDGKTFSSLSAAGGAIKHPFAWPDGWLFWTREKEWTPEMALRKRGDAKPVKAAAPKAVKQPTAKQMSKAVEAAAQDADKAEAKRNAKAPKVSGASKASSSSKTATKAEKVAPKAEAKTSAKANGTTKSAASRNGAKPTSAASGSRSGKAQAASVSVSRGRPARSAVAVAEPEELDI